jgi:UDP-N-acetylglucosamine 2-epimerase
VEAPSFKIPTLNIGTRQEGRARGASVLDVSADYDGISKGLTKVLSPEYQNIAKISTNPYEKAGTLESIFNVVEKFPLKGLVKKEFYKI